MNFFAVESNPSTCLRVVASCWSDWLNLPVNSARLLLSSTNCWSLLCRALTNNARLLATAKKSPRPSLSAVIASDSAFNVVLICLPLPSSPSAKDSMTSPNGPLGWSGVGPSWLMMSVIWLRRSSHSTGTWVRSSGITALLSITGPPVYAGDS